MNDAQVKFFFRSLVVVRKEKRSRWKLKKKNIFARRQKIKKIMKTSTGDTHFSTKSKLFAYLLMDFVFFASLSQHWLAN